jgi:hypothetical protein
MTGVVAGGPNGSTNDGSAPGPASVALRPVGYLLIGLVWSAIWLIAVLLLVGSVPFLAFVDSESLVSGVGDRLANPVEAIAFVVLLLPILALAIGAGGWYVLTASWPLAVLSFTYAVRGLNRSFSGEKLSYTARATWGSTIGLPTVGSVALSLQPVRPTRFTDSVMRYYVAGWSLNGRMILAMLPAGLAWPCAIAALVPGVPELVHMVGAFLAVILLGVSFTLGRRAFRAQLDGAKPQEAEHGVGALSADERARRLKKLREERAGRQ